MKKLTWLMVLASCFVLPALGGCDSGENSVIEAPAEVIEEEAAIDGMSDEEYDAQMDADMQG